MAITHVFHRATVTRIIKETADARTFVLTPDEPFTYRAGQYCTFRVAVDGEELYRSYSMSSAPETDTELATTVKRVPEGKVSNWILDTLVEGDEVILTRPAGTFCLDPGSSAPLLGFAGGSGVTPILSLTKSALASTKRPVRLLCADRDKSSVIFDAVMSDLVDRYPDRLEVVRHIDADQGLIDTATVRMFVGPDVDADCYVCGPEGFMAVVKSALPGPGRVFVENFDIEPKVHDTAPAPAPSESGGTVTIHLDRKKVSVPKIAGETLLESARRAGLAPPFSCEAGNCGTCIAKLTEGHATMRNNDVLEEDEIADGYILTCQGVPDSESITVVYE